MFYKVSQPRWANAEHTVIDLMVELDNMPGVTVAFSAQQNDCESHGRELFEQAVAGKYGPIAAFSGSLAELLVKRLQDLAAKRWEVQVKGVQVFNHHIPTRPDDVQTLVSLLHQMELFDTELVHYKTRSGFLVLERQQLLVVLREMHVHVQRCFRTESTHAQRLKDLENDRDALMAYDITRGW